VSNSHDDNIGQTYAGLRFAMVLLVLLLFGSVLFQVVLTATTGELCLQPSLSAYYYTPARPVFIAALCAVGACLIIYRGATSIENVALDFSGFLAFVVAFVPTSLHDGACDTSNVPASADVLAASTNNVAVLFVAGAFALGAAWLLLPSPRYGSPDPRVSSSLVVSAAALLGGFVFFWRFPAYFAEYAHGAAASALFIGFVVVVVENCRRPALPRFRRAYRIIASGMLGTVGLGVAGMAVDLERVVLWLEAALIAEFAWFWVVQTAEFRTLPASGSTPAGIAPVPGATDARHEGRATPPGLP
jgi:hypothetical protein